MPRITAALLWTALLLESLCFAGGSSQITAPPALHAVISGGFSIAETTEGPSGLTGYLLTGKSGSGYVFWVTPDGKSAIYGNLFNEAGENLTAEFREKYERKPDLNALWLKLMHTRYIATGASQSKGIIYAFVDPNCPFCHLLWMALKPYERAGLQVRWIETGFLREDSLGKAAAIVDSADPIGAFSKGQERFTDGGVKPIHAVPKGTSELLEDHLALMNGFGFRGVPAIVYRDASGVIHTQAGMPKLKDLPALTAIPEQQEPAHELDEYR